MRRGCGRWSATSTPRPNPSAHASSSGWYPRIPAARSSRWTASATAGRRARPCSRARHEAIRPSACSSPRRRRFTSSSKVLRKRQRSRPCFSRHIAHSSVDRPFQCASSAATMSAWSLTPHPSRRGRSGEQLRQLLHMSSSSAARSSTTSVRPSPCFSSRGSSHSASPGCGSQPPARSSRFGASRGERPPGRIRRRRRP